MKTRRAPIKRSRIIGLAGGLALSVLTLGACGEDAVDNSAPLIDNPMTIVAPAVQVQNLARLGLESDSQFFIEEVTLRAGLVALDDDSQREFVGAANALNFTLDARDGVADAQTRSWDLRGSEGKSLAFVFSPSDGGFSAQIRGFISRDRLGDTPQMVDLVDVNQASANTQSHSASIKGLSVSSHDANSGDPDGSPMDGDPDGSPMDGDPDGSPMDGDPDGSPMDGDPDGSPMDGDPDGSPMDGDPDGSPMDGDPDGSPMDGDPDGSPMDGDPDGSPMDGDPDGSPMDEDEDDDEDDCDDEDEDDQRWDAQDDTVEHVDVALLQQPEGAPGHESAGDQQSDLPQNAAGELRSTRTAQRVELVPFIVQLTSSFSVSAELPTVLPSDDEVLPLEMSLDAEAIFTPEVIAQLRSMYDGHEAVLTLDTPVAGISASTDSAVAVTVEVTGDGRPGHESDR